MTVFLEIFHIANIGMLVIGSCMTIPIAFSAVSGQFYRLTAIPHESASQRFPSPAPMAQEKGIGNRIFKWKCCREEKKEEILHPKRLQIPLQIEKLPHKWGAAVTLLLLVGVLSASYILPAISRGRFGTLEVLLKPSITSHRGNSTHAPENTMAAFQAAVDDQADYIELDVQQLKDGTLIIMHDSNFKRTTGISKNVWNAAWEEVSTYDAGSWFSPEFEGERIPTLEEVIQFAAGKINLNIELKSTGHETNLESEVVRVIQENHFENDCVITSMQYSVLRRIKELAPDIQTGYVLSVAYGRFYDMKDIDLFSVRADFVTPAMVRELHNRGKLLYAWTVNDGDKMQSLTEMKVDNIITDDPRRARALVYAESTNENLLSVFEKIFTNSPFSTTAKELWRVTFGK